MTPTIFTTPTYRTASVAIPCSRGQSDSNVWQASAETLFGETCTALLAAARHAPGEQKVHMRQVTGYFWGTDGAALGALHPKVELEIRRGRAQQRLCEVRTAAFLIGAASDCDLVLGEPQFAEVHSYLLVSPARVTVRHLGFGPGLSVAGQDVTWATLRHNDELRTGPYEFRVRIEWPAGQLSASTPSETAQAPPAVDATAQRVADKLMSDVRGDLYPPLRLSLHVEGEPDQTSRGVPAGPSRSRTAALATILGQPKGNRGF